MEPTAKVDIAIPAQHLVLHAQEQPQTAQDASETSSLVAIFVLRFAQQVSFLILHLMEDSVSIASHSALNAPLQDSVLDVLTQVPSSLMEDVSYADQTVF